jgi:hypothetical protein
MATMPVLQRSIAFLRRQPLLAFVLMGAFFLLSGTISINLYVVLRANIDLFRMYGAQVIEDGALRQLAEIFSAAFFSVLFFVLFVVCERVVVGHLTRSLQDASDPPPT